MICEHASNTILDEIENQILEQNQIKSITYQILQGLQYLHDQGIIHRDIKPENLLLTQNKEIKICDFGFARLFQNQMEMTDYVSTRWYRSPELLLGYNKYDQSIDIWALGCIFAEISTGLPLFPGNSDLHTLQLILSVLGNQKQEYCGLNQSQIKAFQANPIFEGIEFSSLSIDFKLSLQQKLPYMNSLQLDFIQSCLQIDPAKRLNCDQLLNHQYFDQDFKNFINSKFNDAYQNVEASIDYSQQKISQQFTPNYLKNLQASKDQNSSILSSIHKINITFNESEESQIYSLNQHNFRNNNQLLKKKSYLMHQTTRDYTPIRIQNQNQQYNQNKNLKEVSSFENIQQRQMKLLPNLKLNQSYLDKRKVQQISLQKNQKPIQIISFPKLIDQQKNNESTKSKPKSVNQSYVDHQNINHSLLISNVNNT